MRISRLFVSIVVLAVLFTTTAFAVSRDEARDIAAKYVPDDCVCEDVDREGFSFEVKFNRASSDEKYEVTVKSVSGTPVKVESEYKGRRREGDVKLTAEDAAAKVAELYPGSETLLSFLGVDDKDDIYQVLFAAPDKWGLIDIGPESGTVFKSEVYFEDVEKISTAQYLPFDEIKLKVLAVAGGKFDEIKLEYDDGRLLYTGEVDTGLFQDAEFEADPTTGKIVDWDD